MVSHEIAASKAKASTGIAGLDDITHGGFPAGRTVLIEGGPGSGKSMLALQTLVHGARQENEPGIFVTFEESPHRIVDNANGFGWDLPALLDESLFILDARPDIDMRQSGDFDLGGLLAALGAKADAIGAKRIVLDALDVTLALLDNPRQVRRELYRIHDWLLERKLSAILTYKGQRGGQLLGAELEFAHFMVDCSVSLQHEYVQGMSRRSIRVVKYRGSAFEENEVPFAFGEGGISVGYRPSRLGDAVSVTSERVSTGVARLDTMLEGGYYRGASILITGAPGTAKTTLCGAFVEAACRRGEPTVFVTFDSLAEEIIRNLASVNIQLDGHVATGLLQLQSAHLFRGSAEAHLMKITTDAKKHRARCLVVDPLSALAKSGNEDLALSTVNRLVDWARAEGITILCTSLLSNSAPHEETTPMQISTVADTWIHLSYVVRAGERNRCLSIVKSRGTGHSNQVRELVLHDEGVTLADVYTAAGEVLMGTMRFEKEQAEENNREVVARKLELQSKRIEFETAKLESELELLQRELEWKRAEAEALREAGVDAQKEQNWLQTERLRLRSSDEDMTEELGQ